MTTFKIKNSSCRDFTGENIEPTFNFHYWRAFSQYFTIFSIFWIF